MDLTTVLTAFDGVVGLALAVVLVVVGLTLVRSAHPGAGMLVAAAGGVKLLLNCCAYWPEVYFQLGGYDQDVSNVGEASIVLAIALQLVSYGLVAAAALVLGRSLAARRATGGEP